MDLEEPLLEKLLRSKQNKMEALARWQHHAQVYYDLAKGREERGLQKEVAIVRVEQLAPFPFDLVMRELRRYPKAQIMWSVFHQLLASEPIIRYERQRLFPSTIVCHSTIQAVLPGQSPAECKYRLSPCSFFAVEYPEAKQPATLMWHPVSFEFALVRAGSQDPIIYFSWEVPFDLLIFAGPRRSR